MCVYVYLCRTEATYYLYVRDDHYDDDREYILLTWLSVYCTAAVEVVVWWWCLVVVVRPLLMMTVEAEHLDDAWIDEWMTVNTRSLHYEAAQSSTEAVRVCVCECGRASQG